MIKNKSKNLVIFALVLVLTLAVVSASVKYNDNNLRTSYTGGENIDGTVIINVSNEPASSKFSVSGFSGDMALIDLIKANNLSEGADYQCSVTGCGSDYAISGSAINSLSFGGEKTLGFKIIGDSISVNSISLKASGSAGQSCTQTLTADFLADGNYLTQSKKYSVPCGLRNYGCFDSSQTGTSANIGPNNYCETMNLAAAPAYEIGAKINGVAGQNVSAQLLSEDGANILGECIITLGSGEQESSCIVKYSNPDSAKYRVCVHAGSTTTNKIKFENSGEVCGTDGSGNKDFAIFGRAMSFDASPVIEINNSANPNLVDEVNSYISEHYANTCPDSGCIIPLKFSGISQTLSLSDIKLNYRSGGTDLETSDLYALDEKSPTVSGDNIVLNLGYANIIIPTTAKSQNISVKLGSKELFKQSLTITSSFDFDISPKFAPTGINTVFSISTTADIGSATWNFGDGSAVFQGAGKNMSHRFVSDGEYTVTVDAVNAAGVHSVRKFVVLSGEARTSALILINRYNKRIADISGEINSYSSWISQELKGRLNVSSVNSTLAKAKSDLNNNLSAGDIVTTLLGLNVPYAVATSETQSYPIAVGYGGIDPSLAGTSYGKEVVNEEGTRQSIIAWMDSNYQGSLKITSVSQFSDSGSSVIFNDYILTISQKTAQTSAAKIFINYPLQAMRFKENYGQSDAGSGTEIPATGQTQTIEFSTDQPVDIESLGIYISPSLENLPVVASGTITPAEPPKFVFNPWLFFIGLILLLTIFFVVYIAIQEWFKKNYEDGLFPKSDDLYNIITFISNSRKKNMSDSEIRKKLENSGWRKEQIKYAFDKVDGKRGSFEIPLFRAAEKKKIEEEVAKRSGLSKDTKFIKRS